MSLFVHGNCDYFICFFLNSSIWGDWPAVGAECAVSKGKRSLQSCK